MSLLYNSPRLFDRSSCLVESFSHNEKKHRFVFFTTLSGLKKAEALIQTFGKTYELYVVHETEQTLSAEGVEKDCVTHLSAQDFLHNVAGIMKKQKIGTQLYIAADWEMAKEIFTTAIEAGFLEEEIQVYVVGEKERHTYCPSCYTLTPIQAEDEEVRCPSCNVMLVVSPFYSKVRNGYLGYPYVD